MRLDSLTLFEADGTFTGSFAADEGEPFAAMSLRGITPAMLVNYQDFQDYVTRETNSLYEYEPAAFGNPKAKRAWRAHVGKAMERGARRHGIIREQTPERIRRRIARNKAWERKAIERDPAS